MLAPTRIGTGTTIHSKPRQCALQKCKAVRSLTGPVRDHVRCDRIIRKRIEGQFGYSDSTRSRKKVVLPPCPPSNDRLEKEEKSHKWSRPQPLFARRNACLKGGPCANHHRSQSGSHCQRKEH